MLGLTWYLSSLENMLERFHDDAVNGVIEVKTQTWVFRLRSPVSTMNAKLRRRNDPALVLPGL